MDNPFSLFPEEVWEMVLNNLEDSNDILNTLTAFPELQVLLKKNIHLWLFDKAIPHLFLWLSTEELLNCRRTCTRWARGVDTFLENHPSLRANEPGEPLWNPDISPRHYNLRDHFPDVDFSQFDRLTHFVESANDHPTLEERNPFVGRSIRFAPEFNNNDEGRMHRYWKVAKAFLTVFGKHVWFIDIRFSYYPFHFHSFCELVFDLLSRLPNLKRLALAGPGTVILADYRVHVPENIYQKHLIESIPHLSHLETVIVESVPPFIVNKMMERYSQQIRKLSMQLGYYEGEGELPTNLTELTITELSSPRNITAFLRKIKAENLASLEVICDCEDKTKILVETDIMPCFLGLPRLQRLEWKCPYVNVCEFGISSPPNYPIPLKTLVITDSSDLGYDFIRNMPSLEYLIISKWNPEQVGEDGSVDSTFSTTIRECLYEMKANRSPSDSEIWELLPNLKAVTLEWKWYIEQVRIFQDVKSYYSRDAYEYGKKKKSVVM